MTPRQRAHLAALHPVLRERMEDILERMGGRMVPIDSHRSPEKQARLYDKGRRVVWGKDWSVLSEQVVDKRLIVTKAKPFESAHNYDPARGVDCVLNTAIVKVNKRDGVPDAWETGTKDAQTAWADYGALVVAKGLVWGGAWKMRDLPHAELVNFRGPEWD